MSLIQGEPAPSFFNNRCPIESRRSASLRTRVSTASAITVTNPPLFETHGITRRDVASLYGGLDYSDVPPSTCRPYRMGEATPPATSLLPAGTAINSVIDSEAPTIRSHIGNL